jgi:hypothetical protein
VSPPSPPPPPPSPSPSPPLSPGQSVAPILRFAATLQGSVEDFNATAFRHRVAALFSVPASSVAVSAAAASILVTATLRMASPQAAEAAEALLGTSTPAVLTAQLGVTVLAVTEVFVDLEAVIPAPSPPPPSPPPSRPPPLPPLAPPLLPPLSPPPPSLPPPLPPCVQVGDSCIDLADLMLVGGLGLVGLALGCAPLLALCTWRRRARTRRKAAAERKKAADEWHAANPAAPPAAKAPKIDVSLARAGGLYVSGEPSDTESERSLPPIWPTLPITSGRGGVLGGGEMVGVAAPPSSEPERPSSLGYVEASAGSSVASETSSAEARTFERRVAKLRSGAAPQLRTASQIRTTLPCCGAAPRATALPVRLTPQPPDGECSRFDPLPLTPTPCPSPSPPFSSSPLLTVPSTPWP